MKQLAKRNYKSIIKRGLITKETDCVDFFYKIKEEVDELGLTLDQGDFDQVELADVILTCLNMAHHYNINVKKLLKYKIKINENRS